MKSKGPLSPRDRSIQETAQATQNPRERSMSNLQGMKAIQMQGNDKVMVGYKQGKGTVTARKRKVVIQTSKVIAQ
jgi:hypothetical protein